MALEVVGIVRGIRRYRQVSDSRSHVECLHDSLHHLGQILRGNKKKRIHGGMCGYSGRATVMNTI